MKPIVKAFMDAVEELLKAADRQSSKRFNLPSRPPDQSLAERKGASRRQRLLRSSARKRVAFFKSLLEVLPTDLR